jgi:hypothetical protein
MKSFILKAVCFAIGAIIGVALVGGLVAFAADTFGPGPMGRLEGTIPNYPPQPANMVFASPSTGAGRPSFRLLQSSDMVASMSNVGPPTSTAGTLGTGSVNGGGKITSAASGTPTTVDVIFAGGGFANQAFCNLEASTAATAALTSYISAQSKTGFTITVNTGTNSFSFYYVCHGN